MQITSHYPNVSLNTANPATEQARRDMQRRELIEPVRDLEKSAAERPLQSDDRNRTATPANASVSLYDSNGKETETQQAVSARDEESSSEQQQSQQQQQGEQQAQAEQQEIRELQARDQEVRAHEQAHATIGGRYAGTPSYEYQQGPDGRRYAVGGEVQIDLAAIPGDPQATIQKMQQVKAAALAPAEPSNADRRIAGEATNRLLQAQAELIAEKSTSAASKVAAEEQQSTAVAGLSGEQNSAVQTAATRDGGTSDTVQPASDVSAADAIGFASDTRVGGIVLPQRERLEQLALMQQRSQVIQNFYQLATEPRVKQYLQQV